jgi:hypothetical protein
MQIDKEGSEEIEGKGGMDRKADRTTGDEDRLSSVVCKDHISTCCSISDRVLGKRMAINFMCE